MTLRPNKLIRRYVIISGFIALTIVLLFLVISIQTQFSLGEASRTATAGKQLKKLVLDVLVTMTYQAQLQQTVEKSIDGTLTAQAPTVTPSPTVVPTGSATPRAIAYGTRLSTKDGMVLVYIPAGDFIMGSPDAEAEYFFNEKPEHHEYLDSFWIDKTQVTNAMYALCVNAGVCSNTVSPDVNTRYNDPAFANHPVVYVTWEDAAAYCAWKGGWLPTGAEWEKAARGPYGFTYPWGEKYPNPNLLNAKRTVGDTTPVGNYPEGQSYYGVLDMGGNVREWVADWYNDHYYKDSSYKNPQGPSEVELRALKGASYQDPYLFSRAANSLAHYSGSPGMYGFRCVIP
ncbi:MAG: formylglycine-generating enzyme family protein [Anaerolineales bacterium]|nr:formylglycine-generating enzyme family protein [Anaerolineales bacterium]